MTKAADVHRKVQTPHVPNNGKAKPAKQNKDSAVPVDIRVGTHGPLDESYGDFYPLHVTKTEESRGGWAPILLGIVILIAVLGTTVWYLQKQQKTESKQTTTSQSSKTTSSVTSEPASSDVPPTQVVFEHLNTAGSDLSVSQKKNYVIRTSQEWEMLLDQPTAKGNSRSSSLTVDFSKNMVIAVYSGQKSSSGYTTKITKVEESATGLEVFITEETPDPTCGGADVLTYPYDVITLPQSTKSVTYSVASVISPCQ